MSSLRKTHVEGLHDVYCLSVPDTWILTRRNGKVHVSSNCNFGFPGGLGYATFQSYAKDSYGVIFTAEESKDLKHIWLDTFPEMEDHLKPPVDGQFKDRETGEDKYIGKTTTGRIRRNCSYCSACNYPFQGLSSDGARLALWYMWLEQYRMVNFIHDEIMSELRDDEYLQWHVKRIDQLMIAGMQAVIPDVKISVEGALMRRWYKEAESVYDEHGNLLVWEPAT